MASSCMTALQMAYVYGFEAAEAGLPDTMAPYDEGTEAHAEWLIGWRDAVEGF